jgi:hypothetical protein
MNWTQTRESPGESTNARTPRSWRNWGLFTKAKLSKKHRSLLAGSLSANARPWAMSWPVRDRGEGKCLQHRAPHPGPLPKGGWCKSPRVMCLGESAKLSAEQKKEILPLLGKRIEVRAKCREVRNSVESAMYKPVAIMNFPDAAPHPCPRPAKRGKGNFLPKSDPIFY